MPACRQLKRSSWHLAQAVSTRWVVCSMALQEPSPVTTALHSRMVVEGVRWWQRWRWVICWHMLSCVGWSLGFWFWLMVMDVLGRMRVWGSCVLVARVIFIVGASEIYGRCVRWGFLCTLGYSGIVEVPLLERWRLKTKRLAVVLENC